MRYLLLIHTSEEEDAKRSPEQQEANMGAYFCFHKKSLMTQGKILGVKRYNLFQQPPPLKSAMGNSLLLMVHLRRPKSSLGGYYMVNADNLDEAIQWGC